MFFFGSTGLFELIFWQRKYLPTTSISFEHGRDVFCTTQTTPSVTQGGYGGSTSQGGQASAGGYAMPQGFREVGQKSYNAYQSTVYEPFGNTTPSESSASSRGVSGRRNSNYEGDVNLDGWGDPTTANPGNTSTQSPIGEPWIMLLFAAAATIVVAWRRRKVA